MHKHVTLETVQMHFYGASWDFGKTLSILTEQTPLCLYLRTAVNHILPSKNLNLRIQIYSVAWQLCLKHSFYIRTVFALTLTTRPV